MRQAITLSKDRKGQYEYWVVRWYDMAGKRRSKSIGRTDELKEKQAQKEALRLENSLAVRKSAERMRLKEFTDLYLELQKHELSTAAQALYKTTIGYLIAFFGENRTLDTITPADAAHFKAALENGRLKSTSKTGRAIGRVTVSKHLRNCRAMFNYGKDCLNVQTENPFAAKRLFKTVKQSKQWHYVSKEDFRKMLDAALPEYRALIALCRLAGLRRLEAYYLQWQDVNFDKGRIYICGKKDWQPKDRESRTIPLCPQLAEILLSEFRKGAPIGAVNVCTQTNLENLNRSTRRNIKRAGFDIWEKPLHTLRKSCITDWAGEYPIHVVKQWSGHSSISTTDEFYLKAGDDFYDKAAGKVTEKVTEKRKSNEQRKTA